MSRYDGFNVASLLSAGSWFLFVSLDMTIDLGGQLMHAHCFDRRSCAMVLRFLCTEDIATPAKHEGQGQQKDEEMWYSV